MVDDQLTMVNVGERSGSGMLDDRVNSGFFPAFIQSDPLGYKQSVKQGQQWIMIVDSDGDRDQQLAIGTFRGQFMVKVGQIMADG